MSEVPGSEQRLIAGRYRLLSPLGQGGMGVVWRGRDEVLGREVAVKEVLAPPALDSPDVRRLYARLEREAWAAARISHRNVVTVYDVATEDGRPWIVMELVRGLALSDVLDAEGPLSPRRAAHIGAEVLAALRAAHEAGVLHRDVKPANVLLANDGRVVLTDFGIAMVAGTQTLTMTGEVVGSPEFLAPERALGRTPGPASDLWSLGVLLYAAVEGHSPFRQDTPLSTLRAVVDDELPPPRRAGPLAPVIEGLLRKDPAERLPGRGGRAPVADRGGGRLGAGPAGAVRGDDARGRSRRGRRRLLRCHCPRPLPVRGTTADRPGRRSSPQHRGRPAHRGPGAAAGARRALYALVRGSGQGGTGERIERRLARAVRVALLPGSAASIRRHERQQPPVLAVQRARAPPPQRRSSSSPAQSVEVNLQAVRGSYDGACPAPSASGARDGRRLHRGAYAGGRGVPLGHEGRPVRRIPAGRRSRSPRAARRTRQVAHTESPAQSGSNEVHVEVRQPVQVSSGPVSVQGDVQGGDPDGRGLLLVLAAGLVLARRLSEIRPRW